MRLELADHPQRSLAVGRRLHLEALVLQPKADEVHDAAFVVDDKHPRATGGCHVGSRLCHLESQYNGGFDEIPSSDRLLRGL